MILIKAIAGGLFCGLVALVLIYGIGALLEERRSPWMPWALLAGCIAVMALGAVAAVTRVRGLP